MNTLAELFIRNMEAKTEQLFAMSWKINAMVKCS
jgi:hypothetical protein